MEGNMNEDLILLQFSMYYSAVAEVSGFRCAFNITGETTVV